MTDNEHAEALATMDAALRIETGTNEQLRILLRAQDRARASQAAVIYAARTAYQRREQSEQARLENIAGALDGADQGETVRAIVAGALRSAAKVWAEMSDNDWKVFSDERYQGGADLAVLWLEARAAADDWGVDSTEALTATTVESKIEHDVVITTPRGEISTSDGAGQTETYADMRVAANAGRNPRRMTRTVTTITSEWVPA